MSKYVLRGGAGQLSLMHMWATSVTPCVLWSPWNNSAGQYLVADVIYCVWIQMHLLPYNLCPCRTPSAKAGGNGKGWKGAINFGPSGKQHPVDSAVITSSSSPCAFVTDQLPTFKCNYCKWGTLQFQALAPSQSYAKVLQESIHYVSGTEMLPRSMNYHFCFLHFNKTETSFKVNFRMFFVVRSNLVASKGWKLHPLDSQMHF